MIYIVMIILNLFRWILEVEILAEQQGHRVLCLPVHHPELNPLECVWNTATGECARLFAHQTSFQDQRRHLAEAFCNKIDFLSLRFNPPP